LNLSRYFIEPVALFSAPVIANLSLCHPASTMNLSPCCRVPESGVCGQRREAERYAALAGLEGATNPEPVRLS
jgi:hypothetical protein